MGKHPYTSRSQTPVCLKHAQGWEGEVGEGMHVKNVKSWVHSRESDSVGLGQAPRISILNM